MDSRLNREARATSSSDTNEERSIIRYSNKVQGFAYGGAAALVVIIGLRSVYGREIPTWVVVGALLLEALLLLMIATVYYFTPEEKGGARPSTDSQILTGEKEILNLLRHDILSGEQQILEVLRKDMVSVQRETAAILRNEILAGEREIVSMLRNEITANEAETLSVLQRIDTQIGKLVENELDRIVQNKIQEVLAALVKQDIQKSNNSRTPIGSGV